MARRQHRSWVRDLGVTAAVTVALIALGGVLWAVWTLRPAVLASGSPSGSALPTVQIRAEELRDKRWMAWVVEHPYCVDFGYSEEQARASVGLAYQGGVRGECKWTPADSAPGGAALGWYPDPNKLLGEDGLRYWSGSSWGSLWSPKQWGPPPTR